MAVQTINLGFVKSIFVGISPPANTECIWYDDNSGQKIHKVYNEVTSAWEPLGNSGSIDVIDNLTSTSTTDALSANQGRILDEKITQLDNELSQDIADIINNFDLITLDYVTDNGNSTTNNISVGNIQSGNVSSEGTISVLDSGVNKGQLSFSTNFIVEGVGNDLILRRQSSGAYITLGTNITFSGISTDNSLSNALTLTSGGALRLTSVLNSNRTITVGEGLTGGGSLVSNISIGIDEVWFNGKYEVLTNKVTNLNTPNNTTYPTTQAVQTAINDAIDSVATYTFSNGLYNDAGTIKLGNDGTNGLITEQTILLYGTTTPDQNYVTLGFLASDFLQLGKTLNNQAQVISFTNNDDLITIEDSVNNKGIEYVSDYSSNFTDLSLVNKKWVLDQFAGLNVLGTQLTGFVVGTPTIITDSDTVLSAFENIQGQLNVKVPNTRTIQITGSDGIISSDTNALNLSTNRVWDLSIDSTYVGFDNYYTKSEVESLIGGNFVGGRAVFSGDGIKTEFDIPHGVVLPIVYVNCHAASEDAAGIWYIQTNVDNSNVPLGYIRVKYSIAPNSGTDNIIIYWGLQKSPVIVTQSDLYVEQII